MSALLFSPPPAEVDRIFDTYATTSDKNLLKESDCWKMVAAVGRSMDRQQHDLIFSAASPSDKLMCKFDFTERWLPRVAERLGMTTQDLFIAINKTVAGKKTAHPSVAPPPASAAAHPSSAEVNRIFDTYATTAGKQLLKVSDSWNMVTAVGASMDQQNHALICSAAATCAGGRLVTKFDFTERWLPRVANELGMTTQDLFIAINNTVHPCTPLVPRPAVKPKGKTARRSCDSDNEDVVAPLRVPTNLAPPQSLQELAASVRSGTGAATVVMNMKDVLTSKLYVQRVVASGPSFEAAEMAALRKLHDSVKATSNLDIALVLIDSALCSVVMNPRLLSATTTGQLCFIAAQLPWWFMRTSEQMSLLWTRALLPVAKKLTVEPNDVHATCMEIMSAVPQAAERISHDVVKKIRDQLLKSSPHDVIARLTAVLSHDGPLWGPTATQLRGKELGVLLHHIKAQRDPEALFPTLKVVLRSPLAGSAIGEDITKDLSPALVEMTEVTLAAAAATRAENQDMKALFQRVLQTASSSLAIIIQPSDSDVREFCCACTSNEYRSVFQAFGKMLQRTNATADSFGAGPAIALLQSAQASITALCLLIAEAVAQRHVMYNDLARLQAFAPSIKDAANMFAPDVVDAIGPALAECAVTAKAIVAGHDELQRAYGAMQGVEELRPAAVQLAAQATAARQALNDVPISQWAPVAATDVLCLAEQWKRVNTSHVFRFLWGRSTNARGSDSVAVEDALDCWRTQMADVETEWAEVVKAVDGNSLCVSQAVGLFPLDPNLNLNLCSAGLANSAEAHHAAQNTAAEVEQSLSQLIEAERAIAVEVTGADFAAGADRLLVALRAKSMQQTVSALQVVSHKLGVPFPADHPFVVLTTALNNDATVGEVAAAFESALQSEQGLINKLPMGFLAAFEAALEAGMPRLCREFPSHAVLCKVAEERRRSCTQDLQSALDTFIEAHAALSQGNAVISNGFDCWKESKFSSSSALIKYLVEISWAGERLATSAPHLKSFEQALDGDTSSHEGTLLQLLDEAHATLHGPDGWAKPRADPAAEVQVRVQDFADTRAALSMLTASDALTASAGDVAEHRARCCTAAENLVACLPPLLTSEESGDTAPCCATGVDACSLRPPPELISALVAAVAAAKKTHADAVAGISRAASHPRRPVAAAARATAIANEACGLEVEALQEVMKAANAALTGAAALSAEECGHHRSIAESLLEAESPWAGDVGLQRRDAAITSLDGLTAHRKAAQQAVKRAERAITRAELDLHSDADDDDEAIEAATTALQTAKAQLSAALPELHTATAAVQQWATSGEGALALQAFPGDAVLTSALSGLFEADFNADTALPRTPTVDMAVEYAAGLTESPDATCVYYAERSVAGNDGTATDVPVVLRRLRLSTAEHVEEAKRQLRDAGRIAVGLQACPDAAAGCPPVVKATRWFMAKGPGGGVADAWLEFPRARHGTLAEALLKSPGVFSVAAASGLCQRLVRAVAQLHAAGIRHGDLNPSNVVLWDDPGSTVVRPGIIDLLDTVSVGATRTLRGATMEWLPPEAVAAMTAGEKVLGTRQLDLWQLGRICQAVLSASNSSAELVAPVREVVAELCVADPAARRSAGEVLFDIEAAIAGAADATATARRGGAPCALPPASWLCQRGAASGVDFVELDTATDAAAIALTACAVSAGRRVRAVFRLENVRLWHVYAAERARVGEQAQGAPWPLQLQQESSQSFAAAPDAAHQALVDDVDHDNEVLLFHGAAPNTHRLIAEGGLDPSYSGDRVGSLFGAATCLTPLWAKAANEYARGAGAGVFVTRVAVGRVADCLTTSSAVTSRYRRPPDGHHSVVGRNGTPGVVVAVYRPSQMYPEYLVTFED